MKTDSRETQNSGSERAQDRHPSVLSNELLKPLFLDRLIYCQVCSAASKRVFVFVVVTLNVWQCMQLDADARRVPTEPTEGAHMLIEVLYPDSWC